MTIIAEDRLSSADIKRAVLHRMVMDKRICPHGLKAKWLLEQQGYTVDDRHLSSREEIDAFKQTHGVLNSLHYHD